MPAVPWGSLPRELLLARPPADSANAPVKFRDKVTGKWWHLLLKRSSGLQVWIRRLLATGTLACREISTYLLHIVWEVRAGDLLVPSGVTPSTCRDGLETLRGHKSVLDLLLLLPPIAWRSAGPSWSRLGLASVFADQTLLTEHFVLPFPSSALDFDEM